MFLFSSASPSRWQRYFSGAKIFFIVNGVFILAVFLLGFNPQAFRPKLSAQDLAAYNGHYLTFNARVCAEADLDYKSRRLTLCVAGAAKGRVLVTAGLYPPYDYGDFLKVSGQLQAPPLIDGFDYDGYLARYDIYSVMYSPKIASVPGTLNYGQRAYQTLIHFKQKLKNILEINLPEPEAGFAQAVLLGYKRTLNRPDLNIFARVGLSHMIAISGAHITILSALIINFLFLLGFKRRQSVIIIFIFLILYPLLTGLAASALRAAIMGGLAFLALYHGRSNSLINALLFAAALMLAFNPRLLRADVGFQLSFLAILGIIYIFPLGEKLSKKLLAKIKLKSRRYRFLKNILDTINLALVAQIVILPVALVNFQQLSLIAPLANVVILWAFAPLLASLIIALSLTALIPPLGILAFLPAYLLLKFIFGVSNLLAKPVWAAFIVSNFDWRWGALYYFVLATLITMLTLKFKKPTIYKPDNRS